jgi:hypothetical protein
LAEAFAENLVEAGTMALFELEIHCGPAEALVVNMPVPLAAKAELRGVDLAKTDLRCWERRLCWSHS